MRSCCASAAWICGDENTIIADTSSLFRCPCGDPPLAPPHPGKAVRQPIYTIPSFLLVRPHRLAPTLYSATRAACLSGSDRTFHGSTRLTTLTTRGTDTPPRPASLATKRARREREQRGGAVAPTPYPRCPTTRTHASYTLPCYSSPLCDGKGSPPHSRSPLTQTGMSCTPYESPLCRSEVHSSFLSSWLSGQQPS